MIKEGGKERRQRTNFDGIMDALATAEGGTYLTLCYVSGAKVGKTLTGKNIDVDQFGQDIDQYQQKGTRGYDVLKNFHQGGVSRTNKLPVGLVKRSVIKFHFQTEEMYGKSYGKYKNDANNLLKPYGVEIGDREEKYDKKQDFGGGGVSLGNTKNTQGRVYTHQNGATVDKWDTAYYMIDNGKIYGGINKNAIKSLVSKSDPDGVGALRKIGAQESEIKKYIEELKKLNFSVLKLMYDRILWISCTIDGVKKFAINDKFTDKIGDVKINPNIFLKLANKRYDKMYNPIKGTEQDNLPIMHSRQQEYLDLYGESRKMNRKNASSESKLHRIIKESINKVINKIE